jgi:hypothetical protein
MRVSPRQLILTCQSKAGWSWGCVSAIDSNGRTIWIADAHRDDGKRFVVHADEKLTAFLELDFADCVPGFAAPKHIIPRCNIRLSGVLLTLSSISSSDSFNLSSARLNKPQGLDLR